MIRSSALLFTIRLYQHYARNSQQADKAPCTVHKLPVIKVQSTVVNRSNTDVLAPSGPKQFQCSVFACAARGVNSRFIASCE